MSLASRMAFVLTAVGVGSASLLVGVSTLTKERISLNKQREIEKAIVRVIPGTRSSRKLYEEKYFAVYVGQDGVGRILGYALQTLTGGFQDNIQFVLGVDADLSKINQLYVLEQKETPGLGAKITDEEVFLKFWEGKDCLLPLTLRKPPVEKENLGPTEVNTITGATISAESVLAGVNAALVKVRNLREAGRLGQGDAHGR